MSLLFGDEPQKIARLTPDGATPWVHVVVGRRRVARVPVAQVEVLGLVVGAVWTAELSARAERAGEVLRAKLKAVALLKVRGRTSVELGARLGRAGFSKGAVELTVGELVRDGLVDDRALAESQAQSALARGLSSAAVARRLTQSGHSATIAAAVTGAGPGDDLSRAIEQARNRAARMPESLGAPVRYRRVLAALARLGYEEDVAQEAAAAVVGRMDDGP
jgi:SOS response regulatory protein OraA/RecX